MKAQLKSRIPRHFAFLLAMLAFPALAPAQTTAPQPPGPLEIDSEIVILPTFQVVTDKDIGYIAVDALAGGRTSTPIKLTPSAMSSLTKMFLDDVSVTDVRQALQWSLNVMPSDLFVGKTVSNPFNAWDYNFRGTGQSLQGGAGTTRNYFTFYQVADAYNIERIEFDRGPNSILFGIGTIGGVLSTYTKMARLDRNFATLEFAADTYGGVRATADINKVVHKNLALRFNALLEDARGWRRNDHNKQAALDIGITWKPTDKTQVRLDLEGSKSKNTLLQSSIGEQVTNWDGTTVADTAGIVITSTTAGVDYQRGWSATRYWVYNAGTPGAGIQDYHNAYHTTGIGLPMAPYKSFHKGTLYGSGTATFSPSQLPVLPEQAFTFGSGQSEPTYGVATLWIDHKFTDSFDITLSAYRYSDSQMATNYEGVGGWSIDINRQLPDGSPNPHFGEAYGDFYLSKQEQQRGVSEARIQANYAFKIGPLNQRLSATLGIQRITWTSHQYNAVITDDLAPPYEPNLVWGRYYAGNPHQTFDIPATISGHPVEYLPWYKYWQDFRERHDLANAAIISHSRLWDDHLSILLGARYDDYEYKRTQYLTPAFSKNTAHDTTYSAGFIYFVHGLDWLGFFGNYSRNFNPVKPGSSPLLNGSAAPAATGSGVDYGIRISTKDGKYYASLGRYDTKASNLAPPTLLPFGSYWEMYFDARQQPRDTVLTNLRYTDTQAIKASGYEFEVTANPTESLRIMANLALPDAKYTEAMKDSRAYFAKNLAAWRDAAAAGLASGDPNAITAANNLNRELTNGQNTLDSFSADKTQTKLVNYTASIFGNYTFLRGSLKGFSAGAGVAMYGRQYVGMAQGTKQYASSRRNVHLVFGYTRKILGYETRFALNIDNLLNDRDAVITSYDGTWHYADGKPVPNGFWLPSPITFRLSARVTF